MIGTRLTGSVLVASFLVFIPAALLYFTRDMRDARLLGSPRHVLERSLVILAVVLTTLGFFLLSYTLRTSPGAAWLEVGALVYLFGSVFIVTAEVVGVTNIVIIGASLHRLQMIYVRMSFLGQTAIGFGLARSPTFFTPLGMLTVIWSLGLFAVALVSPDFYFPWMHHMMPLAIGASLK